MKLVNLVLFLFGTIKIVSAEKHCMISTSKISCTFNPREERSLSIEKKDIRTVDLSRSIISEVRSYVKDYINLEELNLSNCWITSLENGTFAELPKLLKLNLSDNLITSFGENWFDELNTLNILILSDNLLNSLSGLHLKTFPKLRVLDVTGNRLKYLPEDVMHKIQNDPTFSLYASNNPWNCSIVHWKKSLEMNKGLKTKFCNSTTNTYLGTLKSKEGKRRGEGHTGFIREGCGFVKCKWWVIGSLWIGVILGNLNKLNKLLYQSRCRKKKVFEKAVGTEAEVHHLLRQERVAAAVEETEVKSKNWSK